MSKLYQAQFTPVIDTAIYAAGDVMADLLTVTGAVRRAGLGSRLVHVYVLDEDDEGAAFDIFFFDRSVTMAAKNSAWAVSDADMRNCLGHVRILTTDYLDVGGNRVARVTLNPGIPIFANAGTSIYAGFMIPSGTPTYTAATDIKVRFGFEQD